MDLSEANQSCYNKDFKNICQRLERKPVSNNDPVEISDKIDSNSITDNEITLATCRRRNDYLKKETESCKIVTDVWHSFNAFQRTIAEVYEKDKLINSDSRDHTSANSCTFPTNTTAKQISLTSETSTSCTNLTESKMVYSAALTLCNLAIQTKLNSGISASKTLTSSSLPTLSSAKPDVSSFKTDFKRLLKSNNPSPSTKSKDKLINSYSCDLTSANSCTFPTNTTEKQVSLTSETSTSCTNLTESKMAYSAASTLCNLAIQTKLNSAISASKTSTSRSLPTLSSAKPDVSSFKTDFKRLVESNNPSPSTKSSNSTLKCTRETVPSVSNNVETPSNLLSDIPDPTIHVLIEPNDKDVKASGIISTQSLPTTEPSTFETTASSKFENISNLELDKHRILRGILNEDDDLDIYQPRITTIESIPTTETSLESHFILGRLRRKTEKCFSKNNLSVIDCDTYQPASLYIPPVTGSSPSSSSVNKGSTFPGYNEDKMLKDVKAYFLENPIRVTGNIADLECKKWIISAPYFSKNFALTHGLTLPNSTPIQEPNLLQELKKENELIQDQELANDIPEKYLRERVRLINDQFKEQFINIRSKHLSHNQAESTSDVISEDILVSLAHADNTSCPRTTNQAHVVKPIGVNTSNSNSHNTDCKEKTLPKIFKISDSCTSIKSNDVLEDDSNNHSFLLQSSNEDNKEIQNSFNSSRVHSGKSNDSLDTAFNMLPHNRDSNEQKDKENSTVIHSRKSSNPQNKVSYSNPLTLQSFHQHVTENSRKRQSEKSHEVLANASNAATCIRKFYQVDEESRKKIRLQENAKNCQFE